MKEKIWLPNENIHDCHLTLSSIVYKYRSVYDFKGYWHKQEKRIMSDKQGYISGHRCERINMSAKCKIL